MPIPRGIEFVPATRAHVGRVATRMRAADIEECAAHGHAPKQALRLSLSASSRAFAVMVGGSPHALIGVTPYSIVSGVGRPWMLGTNEVYRHGRAALFYGPWIVSILSEGFRRLENEVSITNAPAIRLLGWLGFTVGGEVREIGGVRFLPFWKDC